MTTESDHPRSKASNPDPRGGWIVVALGGFVGLSLLACLRMPRALWGLAAAVDLPPWIDLLGALLVVMAFARAFEQGMERGLAALGRGRLAAALVIPAIVIASWLGRIRLHWLGDQAIWLRSLKTDTYHVLEPASFALVRAAANTWPSRMPGQGAFVVSTILGGLYVFLAWLLSGELEHGSPARRAWLWGMLVFTPQSLFFRGYVESYPFLLVSLMALAWILLRALRGEGMRWAWPIALFATSAHVMAVGALPAVLYTGWRNPRRKWSAFFGCCIVLVLVAAWILANRFRMPAHIGSMRMALAVFDLHEQGWDRFLSPRHLLGFADEILLLGGPLLWITPVLPWRKGLVGRVARCLLLLIAPGLIGILMVRLLLGPVRDWDLFASYLYFMTPALAMAWLARSPGPALPRYSSALLGLACVHSIFWGSVDVDVDRGLRRAERLYGEASRFAPEARGRAAEDLAVAERARGNPAGALHWYELATLAMPKHWRYQSNLGSMAQSLGRGEVARQAFTRAVALSPPVRDPYASLGSIYLRERRVPEALATYEGGLRHAGPDFGLYYGKGVCLALRGDFNAAAAALDSALVLSPESAAALLYRGVVALHGGKPREAIAFLQRSLRADPNQEGWSHLIEAATSAGDSALAREARTRSPNALRARS
jgi:tetratricopeptide (TPR) repeat protein